MTHDKAIEAFERYDNVLKDYTDKIEQAVEVDAYVPYHHLRYMCKAGPVFIRAGRIEKAMRWLGFVQACMLNEKFFTLQQLKEHNL